MQEIIISQVIQVPINKVWDFWNEPEHIINWNFASPEWHCPSAENTLEVGASIKSRMEARDGSMGFDFVGIYKEIIPQQKLVYRLEDGRNVEINFKKISENQTEVIEKFHAESENSIEMQKQGWQAILDNFKSYAEGQ